MTDPADGVRLVVLAGGAGRRMGGDKLLLRDASGRLLIRQWFDRLHWPALPLLVRPPDDGVPEELANWPAACDAVGNEGPLRGVETALAATNVDWLLVVAVDTPGIGREQIDWLLDRRRTDASIMVWITRHENRIEPFPLLIHQAIHSAVAWRLAEGLRSLKGLAAEPFARVVDAPDWPADVWANLNCPEDLAAYLAPSPGTPGEGRGGGQA